MAVADPALAERVRLDRAASADAVIAKDKALQVQIENGEI